MDVEASPKDARSDMHTSKRRRCMPALHLRADASWEAWEARGRPGEALGEDWEVLKGSEAAVGYIV